MPLGFLVNLLPLVLTVSVLTGSTEQPIILETGCRCSFHISSRSFPSTLSLRQLYLELWLKHCLIVQNEFPLHFQASRAGSEETSGPSCAQSDWNIFVGLFTHTIQMFLISVQTDWMIINNADWRLVASHIPLEGCLCIISWNSLYIILKCEKSHLTKQKSLCDGKFPWYLNLWQLLAHSSNPPFKVLVHNWTQRQYLWNCYANDGY